MKRPYSPSELIYQAAGGNRELLGHIHHGIQDVNLRELYPHLDLEELIAISAGTWKLRGNPSEEFRELIDQGDLIRILELAYRIGLGEVKRKKNISDNYETKYARLNPYQGEKFQERMNRLGEEEKANILDGLGREPSLYIFENQMRIEVIRRSLRDKIVMGFQPASSKKGDVARRYAGEITRIIKLWPGEYQPIELSPYKPGEQIGLDL